MRPSRRGSPSACLHREETEEEREKEGSIFTFAKTIVISEARRLFGFTLPREDFRELDSHGRDEHIGAIVGTYDNYGSDWSDLCAQVPELAAVVPTNKGGQKGKGKGRQPTLANPAAKPKAAPVAKQGAAEPAAATGSRGTRGTPPQARTESLGGIRASTSASSSELDDLVVKEEPAEEAQAEAPEEEVAEPAAEEEAVKEEAPDFEGAAEQEQGPSPIDADEEAVVHSSPVAEVVSVHSPASPDLSERAFSEPRARGAASRET